MGRVVAWCGWLAVGLGRLWKRSSICCIANWRSWRLACAPNPSNCPQ